MYKVRYYAAFTGRLKTEQEIDDKDKAIAAAEHAAEHDSPPTDASVWLVLPNGEDVFVHDATWLSHNPL